MSESADEHSSPEDDKLPDTDTPPDAINLNVGGKRLTGPEMGFGQLWRKSYRIRLVGSNASPREVIRHWRQKFPDYWPEGSNFYGSRPRIEEGEVAVINLEGPAGAPIATGIAVIQADDDAFSFMTPQGHLFAGVITFTSYREEAATTAQIEALIRAGDPLFELGSRFGIIHRQEDAFWREVLSRLAADLGVRGQRVEVQTTLLDRRVRWRSAVNLWHNSAIRTTLYLPIHALRRIVGK